MTVAITNYFYCLPSLFIASFDPFFEFLLSESNNRDILNKRPPSCVPRYLGCRSAKAVDTLGSLSLASHQSGSGLHAEPL